MHTSAHPQQDGDLLSYTGTLVADAEARWHVEPGTLRTRPVLCMDLQLDNCVHTLAHVEQQFDHGHHDQVKAAARRYRKGQRVTVQAPLRPLRLVIAQAAHIHIINPPVETPAAAPSP